MPDVRLGFRITEELLNRRGPVEAFSSRFRVRLGGSIGLYLASSQSVQV